MSRRHACMPLIAPALAALFSSSVAFSQNAQRPTLGAVDPALFKGLRYRMVGPNRGGRVTAVTGVPSEPATFYMGVASGGVWKTTDAGQNWQPISDGKIPVGSVGAIEVAPSDPTVVYVGTGSDDIRSNVSIGRGVYRSIDGGQTWSFAGLRNVGQIGAVRVHPTNPDIAYVSAIGDPFKPTPDRGIYRTRDGGRTWQKVLFLSDSTGASDLEMQPGNPNVLFAVMWRGQRKPWTIISGAHEGGVYKSIDAGDHWTRLTAGLPNDLVGKGNIAVTPANPSRLYLLYEAKPGGGLYRSEDAGESWTLVNNQASLITRPFYYTTLAADPTNADVVYGGAEGFFKSTDAGKTFRTFPTPHGDNHDMWINHDPGERRRRERVPQWRSYVVDPVQPADRRDLSSLYGQPGALPALRRAAGQHDGDRAVVAAELGPSRGMAHRPGMRDRSDHAASHEPRHRLRLVQGPVQPYEPPYRAGETVLGRRAVAVRQRSGGSHLPISARLADGDLAVGSTHDLLRLAVRASHARRGCDMGKAFARSHRQRSQVANCHLRRTDHPRHDGRRGLSDALLDPRVAGPARRDLDGVE